MRGSKSLGAELGPWEDKVGVLGLLRGDGLEIRGLGLAPLGTRFAELELIRRGVGIFGGEVKILGARLAIRDYGGILGDG